MPRQKQVTLHHHHARRYRKRHIGLFALSLVALALLIGTVIQYRYQIAASVNGSNIFVKELLGGSRDYTQKIHSTYGFDVSYDQKSFYASGVDAGTGAIYLGTDLAENRAYSVVRVTPTIVNSRVTQSSLTLSYHHEITYADAKKPTLENLQSQSLADGQLIASSFQFAESSNVKLGSHDFLRTTWQLKSKTGIASALQTQVVTYTGIVSGHPVSIVINYGLGATAGSTLYDDVISSIRFVESKDLSVVQTPSAAASEVAHRTLLDSVLMSNAAAAASADSSSKTSEKVAALYGPAVVKIYNVYCMDILVDGKMYLTNACNGGVSGSGFFVSQDGYIATNGHVVSSDPKSLVIQDAITTYIKGDSRNLEYLVGLTKLTSANLVGLSATKQEGVIIDALYDLADARFSASNAANNLLVALTSKEPDVQALLDTTNARKAYPAQDTIKPATLVANNFHSVDGPSWGLDGYRASDVAIIKIKGTNFPVTKLGSIADVIQGSNLMILGYPGNATNNGLVEASNSTVTLTTGKVSSIKYAAGSNKKLIETDTTIGHGNSGGPVFADNGNVVGIATYTSDQSDSGGGVFNYIRDIADFKDLARTMTLSFDANSKTQKVWEQGIEYFYDAHYSKALASFNEVKTLYPYDTRVDEFINSATTRINNGEDVQDFPVIAAIVSAAIVLVSLLMSIILIVRHNNRHAIYKQQVADGKIAPLKKGDKAQKVHV